MNKQSYRYYFNIGFFHICPFITICYCDRYK